MRAWGDEEDMVDHSWEGDEDMLAMMDNPDQVRSLETRNVF